MGSCAQGRGGRDSDEARKIAKVSWKSHVVKAQIMPEEGGKAEG